MMTAYPLSALAERQYRGCGHALAAIAGSRAVAIAYVRDIMPELPDDAAGGALDDLEDARLLGTAQRLSEQGDVVACWCSTSTVVERRLVMAAADEWIDG